MRIAVNCRLLVPDKMDGIGRFTFETLQRISKDNPQHQFTFIFDREADSKKFRFPKNVTFKVISPQARHPILWIVWFEYRLKSYLNRNSFDLFLSPEGWIPGGLTCKSLGVIHDLNFEHHPENIIYTHRQYLKYFFPKYAKRASRIATVSEYSKNDISNTYGIDENEIDVVYNGANAIFSPPSKVEQTKIKEKYTDGEEYFAFVGTLHPRKNLEHLFLAFDLYKKRSDVPMKLLIVGNRKWWPSELEKLFQSLVYKKDVVFMGRLEDGELSKVLGASKALTYLPYFEGFGIPILEAFQVNAPVIASNTTSMPEVAHGAALLCNPKSIDEIASAMQEICENETKRAELIEKGKIRAKDFSWDRTSTLLWQSILKTINEWV